MPVKRDRTEGTVEPTRATEERTAETNGAESSKEHREREEGNDLTQTETAQWRQERAQEHLRENIDCLTQYQDELEPAADRLSSLRLEVRVFIEERMWHQTDDGIRRRPRNWI